MKTNTKEHVFLNGSSPLVINSLENQQGKHTHIIFLSKWQLPTRELWHPAFNGHKLWHYICLLIGNLAQTASRNRWFGARTIGFKSPSNQSKPPIWGLPRTSRTQERTFVRSFCNLDFSLLFSENQHESQSTPGTGDPQTLVKNQTVKGNNPNF